MTRQKKILLGCLALLVAAIIYATWETPTQQRITTADKPGRHSSNARSKVVAKAEEAQDRLHTELLSPRKKDFPGAKKNLFGQLYPAPPAPPPPPPAPPAIEPPPVPESAPVPLPPKETLDRVPQPPPPPMARFKLLGYLEIDESKVVFLESDGETFLARRGEDFGGGEFRLVELSEERLVIEQQGNPRQIILPLDDRNDSAPHPGLSGTKDAGGAVMNRPFRPSPQRF